MDWLLKRVDPPIDYLGQAYASNLMTAVFAVGYILSFLLGVFSSNLMYTLVGGGITAVIALVLTVPAWPYFRRHPLKFKKPKSQ